MGFNFPNSPTEGQIFSPAGGPTYVFNSPVWKAMGQGQIAIVSDDAPANPANGQLWWESDTGILFVYVNDGNSSQWVQCGGIQEASDLSSVSADMSIGFRTSGNRFVVNDKADLSGTDVMTVSEVGAVSASGSYSGNGFFFGTSNIVTIGTQASTPGTISLRPNGYNSSGGQTTIDSAGQLTTASNVIAGGIPSGNSTQGTTLYTTGKIRTGCNTASAFDHHEFYNTNAALVGYIRTTSAATAFGTSSDASLKSNVNTYDPAEAIAIIRADPVKSFNWKSDGASAIGWVAQQSYAVDPDLAMPPPPPEEGQPELKFGEEGYVPWGIDYGRRTPYLWAALTHALDEIEALKARIAVLEGTVP